MTGRALFLFTYGAVATAAAASGEAAPVRVPSEGAPPIVRRLGPLPGLTALAISADATQAAAVLPEAGGKGRSVLRLASAGEAEPTEVELPGTGRAATFSPDGTVLFVVVSHEVRKLGAETYLVSVEPDTLKAVRRTALPETASDIAVRAADGLMLVASDGEIRTLRLPALTSGLVFGLRGRNRAVAPVPGSQRILVGRDDGLAIVDLSDPQTREGMPVRARVGTPAPVSRIAMAPDGSEAFALLAGGAVVHVSLSPLEVDSAGSAEAIAWPGAPEPPGAGTTAPATAGPAPAPPPPPVAAEAPAPPPAPLASPSAPAPASLPPATEAAPGARTGSVHGRLEGPASDRVDAVALFGPDNVLHEAARAIPRADGTWSARDLPPGTYRVLPDAGGGRQAVADPPFRTVRVEAGKDAEAPPIRVTKVL